ncbi:MAG: hypothetical protein KAI81_04520 [Candidatus Marinimicrobia bacterium]|nr:hypothetical protein [Candidatus Neomarinimicrobiota bacterium]
MVLARENSAELELWLPVSDSISLKEKAKIVLFLNVEPELPRLAQLEFINYQAEISPEGILAFRARAELTGDEVYSRIGWRGTAKLYGETVPLYYYLFRRPYSAIRQWVGI